MAASGKVGLAVVLLLALVAVALAQPCIECKECKTNNCYKSCQKTCPRKVDGYKCKKFGADAGWKIGKDACGTTQKYCTGSRTVGGPRQRFKVTLTQCENIAYGACQQKAKESALQFISPCRLQVLGFGGYQQCSKQQWNDFFYGEVDELCERAVSVIDP